MQAVERPHHYTRVGAALAAAGAIAVTPLAPAVSWDRGLSEAERAVALAAEASLLNIPFNFFQDLVNIPFNEVGATNVLANSLFFTGNWFTPSATNLWGEDPGDPGHFMGIMDLMFPFAPEVSGVYQPEIDPDMLANGTAGLGQQMAMFAAAMLPVSASCDAIQCGPMVPTDPITGITAIDRLLQFAHSFSNFPNADDQLDLFKYWLKVPLGDLFKGYTFPSGPDATDNPTAGGIVDPSDGTGPGGSVPGSGPDALPSDGSAQPGFGFPGTVEGPNGEHLMPWAGLTFKFDLLGPFQQWFNSLMQPVDWSVNGADPTVGFHFPDANDVLQALKAVFAGMVVDFNPYVPGSPMCPGLCDAPPFAPPNGDTTLSILERIQGIGAPNPLIQQWIDLTKAADAANAVGDVNGATNEQTIATISGLQTGLFTFSAADEAKIVAFFDDINPNLAKFMVNGGFMTDPGFLGPWQQDSDGNFIVPGYDPSLPLDEQTLGDYGGINSLLLWDDFLAVLDPSGGLEASLSEFWDNLAGIFTL